MFAATTYQQRRKRLASTIKAGVVLLLGNGPSIRNYQANHHPFRQDSSFLYYVGIAGPNLHLILDPDRDEACLVGEDIHASELLWTGARQSLTDMARDAGLRCVLSPGKAQAILQTALNRKRPVHILPPYRIEHHWQLKKLIGSEAYGLAAHPSKALIRAVIAQRSIKSEEEIDQIRQAH